MLVFAAGAGVLLAKIGAYRPLHALAFALIAITFGLFTLMGNSTSKVAWVFFELIGSVGTGFTLSTLLPAIMAPLADADTAVSSATYSFVRCFVSLPSTGAYSSCGPIVSLINNSRAISGESRSQASFSTLS